MINFCSIFLLLTLVCLCHGAIGGESSDDDAATTTMAATTECVDSSKSENCGQHSPEMIRNRLSVVGTGNDACKRNNETCAEHSNCCSGICSNFNYLCIGPSTNLVFSNKAPAMRFQDSRPQCKISGDRCDVHDQCCSRNCFGLLRQCVYTPGLDTPSGIPFPPSTPPPVLTNSVNLANRIGETTTSCKAVGEPCDGHKACCSNNCLFFLHQCVYPASLNAPNGSILPLAPSSNSELANRFGETTTCHKIGERCDSHDQCCSKNCLTFLRKCVQPANLQFPSGALSPTSRPTTKPTTGVTTTPDDLSNRFGGNGCSAVGERCDNHNQCCSKNCLVFARQCIYPAGNILSAGNVPTILPTLTNVNQIMNRFEGSSLPKCQAIGDRCSTHDECCSRNCLKFTQKCVYQAGLLAPAGQTPVVNPQTEDSVVNRFESSTSDCKKVGEKCFAHDECCSKNCLYFMHQCVQPAGLRPEPTVVSSPPNNNNNNNIQPTTQDVDNRFDGSNSGVCKKIGDECFDHSDCCSGNCLNFNRQCISTTHPVAPRDPAVYTLRPPLPPLPPAPSVISLNNQHRNLLDCRRNGLSCDQNNDCCSLTCDGNTNVCSTQRANQIFNQGNGGVNNNNPTSSIGSRNSNSGGNEIRKML